MWTSVSPCLEDVMHDDPTAGTAASSPGAASPPEHSTRAPRVRQGLTFVHFPAQHKHLLWDRGCIEGV